MTNYFHRYERASVIYLPIPADLSVASFEAAVSLIPEGLPSVLIVAIEGYTPAFADWLWIHHRGVAVSIVPRELLPQPNAWALMSSGPDWIISRSLRP